MSWLFYALISAAAAAATAILAKLGVAGVPASAATAIRTVVALVLCWVVVFSLGEHRGLTNLPKRSMWFLLFSGLATGVSWLAYFRALQAAPASWVAPIDKLSLPLTLLLAAFVLGETVTWRMVVGVGIMVVGAIVTRL